MKHIRHLLILSSLILAGCDQPLPQNVALPEHGAHSSGSTGRFSVTRVQVLSDDISYGGKRGIYLIKDRDTGKEFVGLSGVGISELGSHRSGRTTVSDER